MSSPVLESFWQVEAHLPLKIIMMALHIALWEWRANPVGSPVLEPFWQVKSHSRLLALLRRVWCALTQSPPVLVRFW